MLCDALVAELRAGLPISTALERAANSDPAWAPLLATVRLGGDIPKSLRTLGGRPGASGLRCLAAGWEVAQASGSALALVVQRIGDGLRSEADAHAEVTAALGPPMATARLLAVLPVFGIAMGQAMGANPLRFLLGTSLGRGCLGSGVALALIGVAWVERLAHAVAE